MERLDKLSACREEQADKWMHDRTKQEDRTFAQILLQSDSHEEMRCRI